MLRLSVVAWLLCAGFVVGQDEKTDAPKPVLEREFLKQFAGD